MKELVLVFSGILFRFSCYAAIISFLFSAGITADIPTVKWFCLVWSALLAVAVFVWAWKETEAQEDQHERRMSYWDAETALIAPPAPEAAPVAPRVPFPPYLFVKFIWDYFEKEKKLPTVETCEQGWGDWKGFNRDLVTKWFAQMVNAGYIVNRRERQYAGDPTRTRAEFEQAAINDNTWRGDIT